MGAVCTTSSREIADVRLAIAANHAPQGLGSLGGGGGNAGPVEPRARSATSGGLRRHLAAEACGGGLWWQLAQQHPLVAVHAESACGGGFT